MLISIIPSVRPSEYFNSKPAENISMKFDKIISSEFNSHSNLLIYFKLLHQDDR